MGSSCLLFVWSRLCIYGIVYNVLCLIYSSKAGSDRHANWHPHVAECIMHTARLLETMLANQSFSRQFVEKGGLQLLLRLYTLKHLPPTFGSSSAAHAVMAAFRACTQLHGALVTEKVAEALAEHLRTTLLLAMVCSI